MRANKRLGFSLMEMMVVLLIVAIIAAASAPLVTKKLTRNGTNESPWQYVGLNNNIAYNINGQDATAIIGAGQARGNNNPRLYIQSNADTRPVISFGHNGNFTTEQHILNLYAFYNGIDRSDPYYPHHQFSIGLVNDAKQIQPGAVVLGGDTNNRKYSVVIGNSAKSNGAAEESIAIGYRPSTNSKTTVAIGKGAYIDEGSSNSVVVGRSQIYRNSPNSVAIGDNAYVGTPDEASIPCSIAIGNGANVTGSIMNDSNSKANIAIGKNATAKSGGRTVGTVRYYGGAIAIGDTAKAYDVGTICIGAKANAANGNTDYSIAIGENASVAGSNSVAIGHNSRATENNQIVLGGPSETVYIPGDLVVGKNVWLNYSQSSIHPLNTYMKEDGHSYHWWRLRLFDGKRVDGEYTYYAQMIDNSWAPQFENQKSDRRLKNVGEKYTAGLEELKKLDFFHYTFKKDENKTPRVGVMAQDLQKVFPDAVVKGKDGYLMIRTEDMFYAVINAVKELDSKISALVEKIDSIVEDITMMKATIEAQQKTIDELKAQNEEIIKTNEKIMKRLEKLEKKKLSKVEE